MSKIFISHSGVNNAAALAIAKWLAEQGWAEYFLDITPTRGLAPGERWQEALRSASDRCEAVLFLISPAWRDSPWCRTEFLLAKQFGKTIFGVLVEATPLDALPKEMTAEWQLCDLVTGTARQSFRVSQEPIVPETDVSFAEVGLKRLRIGLQRAGLDPASFPWPPPSDPNRAPYRGLMALEAEDAAIFFGREWDIVRGLDALRRLRERGVERLFVILGASGGGKSSYLRAGLWPRLLRDDTHFLPLPVIRPERAVVSGATGLAASLETAFRERKAARSRAAINQALQEPGGFERLLTELQTLATSRIEPDVSAPMVVISIDQGEELFGEGRAEAGHFLDLLAQTLSPPAGEGAEALAARQRALAIVAIRSDSYERLQTEPRLVRSKRYLFDLPPIARAEFKTVIVGPAQRHTDSGHKLTVDPALTKRLVDETEGADALPLLAFTLERLFVEHGGDGKLLLKDYETMGGVRGSIEAAVEAAFTEPGREPVVPADKAAREHLLRAGFIPWLARVDPDTEERKRRVARWEEIPPEARPLLERLIEQRLLVRDRRKLEGREDAVVVEVAHEALLRQWSTLTAWLDEDAAALKILETVKRAGGEWFKNREHAGAGEEWLVHTGERLVAAEALRQRPDFERLLGTDGQPYLVACRARDDRLRKEKEERAEAERVAKEHELEQAKAVAEAKERELEKANALAQEQRQRADEQAAARMRQRRLSWGLFAILVLAVGAGFYAWQQKRQTQRLADSARAGELAAKAESLAIGYPDQSVLLALVARGITPKPVPAADAVIRAARASFLYRAVLRGHQDAVMSAQFSPDGKTVVTASWSFPSIDNTARLWDVASGHELQVLRGHKDGVKSAQFSPDGKTVVTASWDKTARLWDAASGRELQVLRGHEGQVHSAQFSPDGKTVVTASRDKTARLWDAASGRELQVLRGHEGPVTSAQFSPDGKTVVTVSGDILSKDNTARLWDVASGRELQVLRGHEGPVTSAQFSPDGKTVVTANGDNTARLWDVASGRELQVLRGHKDGVKSAQFSPDGKRVATVSGGTFSKDNTVWLWDVASGRELQVLRGHEGEVDSAQFSPDSKIVVTASGDNTARLWDVASGRELQVLRGHQGSVTSAQFSPDGKTVVTASWDRTARLWDVTSGWYVLHGHENLVNSAQFSPDGKTVVTAGGQDQLVSELLSKLSLGVWKKDNTARLWDVASGRELQVLRGHEDGVKSAQFSPDGKTVVTASGDKTARLWDAASGRELQVLRGHKEGVKSAQFSPDGKTVVTASGDKTARLWDVASGRELQVLRGHEDGVTSARFSPDGKTVVTASGDKTARLWDAASGRELHVLRGHEGPVTSAQFSTDGKTVVTASGDKTARLWEAASGRELQVLRGHEDGVTSARFSPDGKTVVTASGDKTARLWEAASGRELQVLRGHKEGVKSARFSPDGQTVVTASGDTTARLWDAASGRELQVLRGHEGGVESAQFSLDGKTVATASHDKTARLWVCEVCGAADLIAAELARKVGRELTADERRRFGVPDDLTTAMRTVGQTDKEAPIAPLKQHGDSKDVRESVRVTSTPEELEQRLNKALADNGMKQVTAKLDPAFTTVTLNGPTLSSEDKAKAEAIVISETRAAAGIASIKVAHAPAAPPPPMASAPVPSEVRPEPPAIDLTAVQAGVNDQLRKGGLGSVSARVDADGKASLQGTVTTAKDRDRAIRLALAQPGVTGVNEGIRLMLPAQPAPAPSVGKKEETPPLTATRADPAKLEGEINRALRNAGAGAVTAQVGTDFSVMLKGHTTSAAEKERALQIVRQFRNVAALKVKDMVFVVEEQ